MGCDIHLHIEIKFRGKRNWEHYNNPLVKRNYDLFARMAGVRNDEDSPITAISEPKGLPAELSFITKFDYEKNWSGDAHSESWLSSQEVALIDDEWEQYKFPFGFLFGGTYSHFHKYRESYREEIEDFRFIFWFDN